MPIALLAESVLPKLTVTVPPPPSVLVGEVPVIAPVAELSPSWSVPALTIVSPV